MIEAIPKFGIPFVGSSAFGHWISKERTIRKEQIHPTVIVIIKDGHAATHRLEQILLRSRRSRMFEIDLAECSYVGERHRRFAFRACRWWRLGQFIGAVCAARARSGRRLLRDRAYRADE